MVAGCRRIARRSDPQFGGTIAGTPTTAGRFDFSVTVTDSDGDTDTNPFHIVVDPAPLSIVTSSLSPGTVGVSYSQSLSAIGGTGGYTWNVTSGYTPCGIDAEWVRSDQRHSDRRGHGELPRPSPTAPTTPPPSR